MSTDDWQIDQLDLEGYLRRLGRSGAGGDPSRSALAELHEAHVRAFTFDDIDVLLGQHPGFGLEAVQEKFVGRGGYCFEHSTIFAAALERLGYDVRRRLGRVADPRAGTEQGRTHLVVEVLLDGGRLLCDPGFGMSLLRPLPLVDGAEDEQAPGWDYRLRHTEGGWALHRRRDEGWEVTHTTDEFEVRPVDVVMGHHFTSTFPGSHFTRSRLLDKAMP